MWNLDLVPAIRDNTYTIEFYQRSNNLTLSVDVVSTDDVRAVAFARERFKLETSWEVVGVDKKYK